MIIQEMHRRTLWQVLLVYADDALTELHQHAAEPAPRNVEILLLDPRWDPLRDRPAFRRRVGAS